MKSVQFYVRDEYFWEMCIFSATTRGLGLNVCKYARWILMSWSIERRVYLYFDEISVIDDAIRR